MELPLTMQKDRIGLCIKARPGRSRARAMRIVDIGDGKTALEVSVSAPSEGGRANKAIIQTLAKALGVRTADIMVKAGQTGRIKILEIIGDAQELSTKAHAWALNESELK